jgi:SAM-dependent methyltransferase
MNLEAVWHDLECGDYVEDLALWRELADEAGDEVLDVGAGTGRVTLDLAAQGVSVAALDADHALLDALSCRAAGLPVSTHVADARRFRLGRRFPLIIVPMQTLQLFGGAAGRASLARAALAHLQSDGVLACALADAMDCFDEDHDAPPPAAAWEILGVRYSSQLVAVTEEPDQAVIHHVRTIAGPEGERERYEVLTRVDRVSPAVVLEEARSCGYRAEPLRSVPESEQFLGSTVVVLRAPSRRT